MCDYCEKDQKEVLELIKEFDFDEGRTDSKTADKRYQQKVCIVCGEKLEGAE